MDRPRAILAGALIAALALAGWLWRDNARLRDALSARDHATDARRDEPGADDAARAAEPAGAATGDRASSRGQISRLLSRLSAARERPRLPDEPDVESRGERRERRQRELAAMFGRHDGETAEAYRARMVPFVEMMLAGPRSRVTESRGEIERAAGVTDEQRAELDAMFADVHAEVLELTNRAIASGELTPYQRNWSGALTFAGGVGAVLTGAEARIGQILSAEQIAIIYDSGFEWGEYLGATVPWEQLDAPPPPPGS